MELSMPKDEWGVKRLCPQCASRFYDLKNDPMTCPECENTFSAESLSTARGRSLISEKAAARERTAAAAAAAAVVDDEDDDVLDDDTSDADLDDDLLEDDDDDDDVSLDDIADVATSDDDS
jgi:uncharacterized protein (TIGR02300 family)